MRVTVHVPDSLGKKVEHLAEEKGVSVSSLYAEAIERHMQAIKREEAFEELERLIGTVVAPDFDTQLADLRRDDASR